MEPGQWKRIENLFEGAMPLSAEQRALFLDRHCAGDSTLRQEVESLLRHDEQAGHFLRVAAPARPLSAGARLSHFEILGKLGEGGMGAVYRAFDERLLRAVALKLLPAESSHDPAGRQQLLREARAASSLNHPNIVSIYEVGTEEGADFIAMELVEGKTLAEVVPPSGLPVDQAIGYARQIASGLAKAHAAGLVHRDLKPKNVMLTPEGVVKILDFGLARHLPEPGVSDGSVSLEGEISGTPSYMSPEQAAGRRLDARSDVFSFGSVLYEMLSGRRDFSAPTHLATLVAIATGQPPSLRTLCPGLPAAVARVVEICHEKDPGRRYASAADLQRALDSDALVRGSLFERLRARLRSPLALAVAGGVLAGLIAAGWFGMKLRRHRWATQEALPTIARLAENEHSLDAFLLAAQVDRDAPGEPQLAQMRRDFWISMSFETDPPGATVRIRDYLSTGDWHELGITPIRNLRMPAGNFQVRLDKPGYIAIEATADAIARQLRRRLTPVNSAPPGMVLVERDSFAGADGRPVKAGPFWIDKFEVTNQDYQTFVDAGGYAKREYWKWPFTDGGTKLGWDQALARFVDSTGRPGPADWELGRSRPQRANHPVSGVSWYEAAAYAEFVGKSLPTVSHWAAAADFAHFSTLLNVSNFAGEGTVPAGQKPGLGRFGTYDMAGNVAEWCWNAVGERKWIRGGGFADHAYMYRAPEGAAPMTRRPGIGFRCARYVTPPPPALTAAFDAPILPRVHQEPISDAVFEAYRSIYAYDAGPLAARVETVDDASPWWRRERISFDAAYLEERVILFLFLPRDAKPPYAPVLFFPGGAAQREVTSQNLELRRLDFLLRSGYAVAYPVYKGMYERNAARKVGPREKGNLRVLWVKDAGRTIDYLETRSDLDTKRLAYYGVSVGAGFGPVLVATEPRARTAILQGGGLSADDEPPQSQTLHFLPRVKIPILMLNGRDDLLSPVEEAQVPFFRLLGTAEKDKRHVVMDSGHSLPKPEVVKQVLSWLERYAR